MEKIEVNGGMNALWWFTFVFISDDLARNLSKKFMKFYCNLNS